MRLEGKGFRELHCVLSLHRNYVSIVEDKVQKYQCSFASIIASCLSHITYLTVL